MESIRVWTSGDWSDLANFRSLLGEQRGIALLDSLAGGDPEVVVHVARDLDLLSGELARIREHSGAPIVLLTSIRSTRLLEDAVQEAVAEVLLLPQADESVAFAIQKASRDARQRRTGHGSRGRVVTVFSPKGGTGKSVTATNLAVSLARAGRRTLLVDLDLQFGDVAIMLGLQPQKTLHDLVTAPGRLDGEKLGGYTIRHASGLHVLAAPLRPEDAEEVTDTKIGELLEVAAHEYDVVVVDTAPFLYGPTLETLDRTTDLVLLCAPDVPALKNVRLTLQTLELLSFDTARTRLVLNRASTRLGLGAAEISSVIEREVEFELPEDENVTVAVNRAEPLVTFKAASPFAVGIKSLHALLLGDDVAAKPAAKRRFALGRTR